jgi:hypothetical protein
MHDHQDISVAIYNPPSLLIGLPTTPTTMSVILDDSDPLVDYSGRGWLGHPGEQFVEFGATTHSSGTPGDTATLKFEGASRCQWLP